MTRRGGAWEAQLERLHDRYRRDRLATVFRVHPPVHVVADHGRSFTGVWSGEGPPDFVGTLADGRAVACDAKDCASSPRRWRLALLARHQARDLEAVHLAGGVAFVALRLQGGDAYALPWARLGPLFWAWHESGAAPSVAIGPWWVPFDVAGDGWLPRLAPEVARAAGAA